LTKDSQADILTIYPIWKVGSGDLLCAKLASEDGAGRQAAGSFWPVGPKLERVPVSRAFFMVAVREEAIYGKDVSVKKLKGLSASEVSKSREEHGINGLLRGKVVQ
jgi:hypothetical protein